MNYKLILLIILFNVYTNWALVLKNSTCYNKIFQLLPENRNQKLFCYYTDWTIYRNGEGKFEPENINPYLCTHIIYSFAGLDKDTYKIKLLDPWADIEHYKLIEKINNLKYKNPKLKVLLAIGGWNEGSKKYSELVSSKVNRKKFVDSVINLLDQYGFDGLVVDWEYPNQREGLATDKKNFIYLLFNLKQAFSQNGKILTVAVGAGVYTTKKSYLIRAISDNVDYINLMTYDYNMFNGGSTVTGHNAPFYDNQHKDNNFVNSINLWLESGADPSKLVVGIPTYGRTYKLQNPHQTCVGCPAISAGRAGQYTQEAGYLAYYELCKNFPNYIKHRPKDSISPYITNGDEWISYDDENSVYYKALYANCLNLAGAMVWTIDNDDFRGVCPGKIRYPLIRYIKVGLGIEN